MNEVAREKLRQLKPKEAEPVDEGHKSIEVLMHEWRNAVMDGHIMLPTPGFRLVDVGVRPVEQQGRYKRVTVTFDYESK